VSCGHDFSMFLSCAGVIYAMGQNDVGQLGLGDLQARSEPCEISSLRRINEKIGQVECGFKHVVVRSTLHKLYGWGWGERGQLGDEGCANRLQPGLMDFRELRLDKPLQVSAGFESTHILMQSRRIYFLGSGRKIKKTTTPI
jgi:alpha-tubulin suppressor-like RCC1 family protein